MEEELLETKESTEFFELINKYLSTFGDIEYLKEEFQSLYINDTLVNYIRGNVINKESTRYKKSMKHRYNSDSCTKTSPFCFLKEGLMFSSDTNVVVRTENILDNLKPNYFDVASSNNDYAIKFVKKYSGDTYTDSLYRKRLFPFHGFASYENLKKPDLSKSFSGKNGTKISPLIHISYQNFQMSNNNVSISLISSLMSFTKLRDGILLIVRKDHMCSIKTFTMGKKLGRAKRKVAFFERASKILSWYLGSKARNHVLRTTYRLISSLKVSTDVLVKNHEFRTYLQCGFIKKRPTGKRQCKSHDKHEPKILDMHTSIARKIDTGAIKSISSSINTRNFVYEDETSCTSDLEVDSLDEIGLEFQLAMDTAFLKLKTNNQR